MSEDIEELFQRLVTETPLDQNGARTLATIAIHGSVTWEEIHMFAMALGWNRHLFDIVRFVANCRFGEYQHMRAAITNAMLSAAITDDFPVESTHLCAGVDIARDRFELSIPDWAEAQSRRIAVIDMSTPVYEGEITKALADAGVHAVTLDFGKVRHGTEFGPRSALVDMLESELKKRKPDHLVQEKRAPRHGQDHPRSPKASRNGPHRR